MKINLSESVSLAQQMFQKVLAKTLNEPFRLLDVQISNISKGEVRYGETRTINLTCSLNTLSGKSYTRIKGRVEVRKTDSRWYQWRPYRGSVCLEPKAKNGEYWEVYDFSENFYADIKREGSYTDCKSGVVVVSFSTTW